MPQSLSISSWASWAVARNQEEVLNGVSLSALKTALETQAAVQEALIPPVQDTDAILSEIAGSIDILV